MDINEIARRLKSVSDNPLHEARLLQNYAKDNLETAIQRRLRREPISKIIGERGFWKDVFLTTSDVLDPRPDSETLIETVLSTCPDKNRPYRILDIGTGSGCLLFSLLDEYPQAHGLGIDISDKALAVAAQNQKKRQAQLLKRDFSKTGWGQGLGMFDIVISNPPYIPTKDISTLEPEVRLFDPHLALDGGSDGLEAYRRLALTVPQLVASKGYLFLEIGIGQSTAVQSLFSDTPLNYRQTVSDYGGIERVLIFQKG